VKDFIAFGRGFSFSIPDSAKPITYARVRAALQAESIAGALGAVIVVALLVLLLGLALILRPERLEWEA
jgi:hypothetical protein